MRFIINIVCFLFLLPLIATAQTYKYIGVENGLSNRRIFDIQKDSIGYMWFLTNEGIDRYNGKDIKHYKLIGENKESSSPIHLGWLYFEEKGKLWVIGKAGRIFQYNQEHDVFNKVYKLPKTPVNISYGYMDHNHRIWLCSRYSIALYDTQTGETHQMPNELKSSITSIEQVDNDHFFMATNKGVRYVKLENEALQIVPLEPLDKIQAQISALHFHQESQRLFIGTFEKGVFAYDIRQQRIIHSNTDLSDVNIARIRPLNRTELLIATEGMGIHKINVNSCISEPYITSSYKSYNEMNSNNINDIYIDEEKRIWIANYPEGITIIDNRYKNYNWIKHSIGNRQSLVNDQVHSVIEDSDGDLWFGTSNGISLYQSKTGQWHSFLSSFDHQLKDKNHIFITLCEVSPGIIWAGGYTSGVYKINKRTLSVEYFSPYLLSPDNIRPDKYIRDIVKDSKGYIWSGGFYNLKCFDLSLNSVRLYPGINSVTAITEKDDGHMWIGTSAGLYLLDKESGRFQYVALQEETTYINTLYQAEDLSLYIGTNGSGVVVYNAKDNTFKHYHKDNCALISNNIYTILPESDGHILMSTENGISCFHPTEKTFHNWTKEQGLMSSCFSASSGTLRKNKGFVFGSTDGAIEFPEGTKLPDYVYSPMILSDFQILYQTVVPGSTNSPLKENINQTDRLKLKYNQNTFSLSISSINYDAPDNVTFYWKLEGFYDDWNRLGEEGHLRFTNLASGDYKLYIRAVSKEEPYLYFEERSIDISIARPVWFSFWAIACYVLLTVLMSVVGFRVMALRKQKKISDEKTRFFVNTAHDIRTPLTLIKAPLEEKTFHNWTKEQGLMSSCFSASSGTLRKNKGFVFGSTDGAIEFPEGTKLPDYVYSPMILSDFQILYQTVVPGSTNSPLKENINQTDRLKLKYNQNTFSLSISSINYDAPDNVTFYWKLEGFYDDWNRLGEEGHLRFTNLASGDYKLYIRAVSKEEPYLYFEERSIDISIARPVWFSFWAIACYVLLTVLMSVVGFRVMALRKQKKISDEKTRFFVNTAHDIRTPLTLIKAPLEEMLENKTLNEAETNNMHMALRNVNSLLRMTTNLINFERAEVYSPHLYIAEYELNTYIKEIYNNFQTYATIKHITFRYESNFSYMNVWFDKEKMDSILENVISNALKYTPQNGDILISVYDMKSSWRLEVKDNGIGIPAKEQRKLFKMHFRGTNAINSKITGSGIGLMLVRKLVSLHNGKIYIESTECQGSTVRIILPKEKEQFKNFTLSVKDKKTFYEPDVPTVPLKLAGELRTEDNDKLHRILIVEDNDELRNYLFQSFSPIYNVQVCNNGKEALTIVKQFWPGLILSDIMMPEMRGDELCIAIKNDIETSHIPVVLLTALGDEKNILEGLHIGADEYIVKPFSINILKASIANLLANRALLRKRYANLEINTEEEPSTTTTCSNSLDWKFMSNVKRHIEENMDNPDFTVDVLCSLLNMSRTSFYSKLKALTGQAPADFVRNIRLKHAAELLKEGKYSVTEVAERTGFCDGKYFREVFKKYFNVSPSQYAKGDTPRSPKGEGE